MDDLRSPQRSYTRYGHIRSESDTITPITSNTSSPLASPSSIPLYYKDYRQSGAYRKDDLEQQASHLYQRTLGERIRSLLWTLWLYEVVAGVLSLACLATIVVVLIYENGKELDQWDLSLLPNVVISFIAILAKASIALILSQILSQLKWYSIL